MYVPEIEVPNDVLRARFAKTAPEYIDKMEATTGIKTRWYAPEDWATSDLAVRAARQALSRANVSPEDVDLILVGTDSPDYMTPATSVVVQQKLGATRAGTFDVGCACASFPTALASANHDPDQYGPTSEQVDITRPNAASHVAFGGGVHHCLGAALARLEGQVAIGGLVRRYPEMQLTGEPLVYNGRFVLRGLTALPVAPGTARS
jgi:hypothetical protein